jgi:hypothetical protein
MKRRPLREQRYLIFLMAAGMIGLYLFCFYQLRENITNRKESTRAHTPQKELTFHKPKSTEIGSKVLEQI